MADLPVYRPTEASKIENLIADSPYNQIIVHLEGKTVVPANKGKTDKKAQAERITRFIQSEVAPEGSYVVQGKLNNAERRGQALFIIQKGNGSPAVVSEHFHTPKARQKAGNTGTPGILAEDAERLADVQLIKENANLKAEKQILEAKIKALEEQIESLEADLEEAEDELQELQEKHVQTLAEQPAPVDRWAALAEKFAPVAEGIGLGIAERLADRFFGPSTTEPTVPAPPTYQQPPQAPAQEQQTRIVRPRPRQTNEQPS